MKPNTPIVYTFSQGLEKLRRYCAYQERAQVEVRQRAYELGLREDEIEQALTQLIIEDFVNEERFARAYSRGKFRIKQWGKIKIKLGLKSKQLSDTCVRMGLSEIDEDEYLKVLHEIVEKKGKLYAISRGFERDLVNACT
ncbi:MAG: RecX family transcriptional regulator [Bacteroidales bacterium]